MRKKSENKPSFTFKRIGRKVDNILSFFSIFDLRSAFDGWLDGTLLEFLKDLPEKNTMKGLRIKHLRLSCCPHIRTTRIFSFCLRIRTLYLVLSTSSGALWKL